MRRGFVRALNNFRAEVDAARETGHRRQDRYDPWRAGVARESHPQKGDVPGHTRREDLSQGKETDHVHRAARNRQCGEETVTDSDVADLAFNSFHLSCHSYCSPTINS